MTALFLNSASVRVLQAKEVYSLIGTALRQMTSLFHCKSVCDPRFGGCRDTFERDKGGRPFSSNRYTRSGREARRSCPVVDAQGRGYCVFGLQFDASGNYKVNQPLPVIWHVPSHLPCGQGWRSSHLNILALMRTLACPQRPSANKASNLVPCPVFSIIEHCAAYKIPVLQESVRGSLTDPGFVVSYANRGL
jgi:hypothetical protein